ncbi:RNA polymerase sigma factor [Luteitalea sp.]|jgi:RNA polymerase sigma-70 factor (ECF subfamily)|uniref:RNA polymerase sigma factor n=1 Tax=Luteitalea sp. TaxID=2004800 RepID=UPI0037CA28A5
MSDDARRAAEHVARHSYGRLLSYLATRTRDVAAAEDALADALHAALRTWPTRGVPDRPDAWLLTAARHALVSSQRRQRVRDDAVPALTALMDQTSPAGDEAPFPDERLKLLFICAHPAIDRGVRAPLMLQVVLGLDAARLASAFVVSPSAMSQRLVRAKKRIAQAGIPFDVPTGPLLEERLGDVLEAIYAAFGVAWQEVVQGTDGMSDLAEEAIWLCRVVVDLLPDAPEARGLLALMLHSDARRNARRTPQGRFVPLVSQDVSRWDASRMDEADRLLHEASRLAAPGPFQIEAAIQAAHASRRHTGLAPWSAIAQLYEGLVRLAPSLGARVGHAAAVAETEGAEPALRLLDDLSVALVNTYQPYWALRAQVLARLGEASGAREAYARAAGLASDPAVRAFLLEQAAGVPDTPPADEQEGRRNT